MFAQGLSGLGLTVTLTTRFDPNRIRERLTYWLEEAANQMAAQARQQINSSGVYYVDENGRARRRSRATAIDRGLKNLSWVVRSVEAGAISSTKSMALSMVKNLGLAIGAYWIPGIGWAMALYSVVGMFGKKEKKPYPIPWEEIYSQALPYAKAQTNKEELDRIEAEKVEIKHEVEAAVTKQSETAAMFKLPEGVTSITGGALVMNLQSQSHIVQPTQVKEVMPVGKPVVKRVAQQQAPVTSARVAYYR